MTPGLKPSAFDLQQQNQDLDSRIIAALERVSEAFRVLLWNESKENSLSPIQTQILIFLLFHPAKMGRISYIAQEFNLTKPTVSDSVKVLLSKELVTKETDPTDSRSHLLALTPKGETVARQSAAFTTPLLYPLNELSATAKTEMLTSLLQIIGSLHQAGVIGLQRMCFYCLHYRRDEAGHFCNLMQKPLKPEELRLDCPEHLAKTT